jgi:hypothetical protein
LSSRLGSGTCGTHKVTQPVNFQFAVTDKQKKAREKQKLIRENFPSHQFIHLRLFAFNEYPPTAGMRIRVPSLAF